MKLLTIHKNPLNISYKHQICSIASLFVLLVTILIIVLPFVLIHSLYKHTWNEELLSFEQPNVRFTYKYIFTAVLQDLETGDEKLVTCSSFTKYNALTEEYQECNGITYIDFDTNHDQKVDQMRFKFLFDTDDARVRSYSTLIFLDTVVEKQCRFIIPTVIAVEKDVEASQGTFSIKGPLIVTQKRPLVCPFFLRNIKSHFYYNLIDQNSTRINDYSVETVKNVLEMNPVHLKFYEENSKIISSVGNVSVDIILDIGDVMLRYKFTLWQVVNRVWIQYLAVFVVFYVIGEKVKDYLFRNQYLAAWEVVPWKKLR